MFAQIEKCIAEEQAFTERLKAVSERLQILLDNQKKINAEREAEIKKLEREINDTIFDQKRTIKWPAGIERLSRFPGAIGDYPGCLWNNLSPEDRMKPMGLSCPCPRCSPYSISFTVLAATNKAE